jgi:bifunctional DNA-binding transcriptional regulator/antitoxin component of YhaV-PrlF toxin-antitoxin module
MLKWINEKEYYKIIMKIIRKITSSGKYSKVITIPREFLKALDWRQNQNLEFELDEKGKKIVISDAKDK